MILRRILRSSPAIVGPSIQGQCSAESQIFPQPWIRLLSIITWGWWPPHWWREPSWCQRWQRFSHHLQPPEVAVVCPIKRQDVALLFLLVSCKDSPSSTALDWHEQSDKKFRRFGRRNQLSDRTCPQIISAFGKHYWNWSFTAVTICDFDVRNKPYCLTFFPCQHRDQKCKWIGPLNNLFFYRRYQRDRAGLLDPLPYNLYHICLLTRGVLGLYENTHRHAPFSQKIHHFWWIVTTSGWWTHTEYLFMEMKIKMFHLPSCCSNGIANNRHLVKDLVHIGDITPRLKTRSLSQYLV